MRSPGRRLDGQQRGFRHEFHVTVIVQIIGLMFPLLTMIRFLTELVPRQTNRLQKRAARLPDSEDHELAECFFLTHDHILAVLGGCQ